MDEGEFHWTDGWMFKRLPNGDVRIRKAHGKEESQGVYEKVDVELVIPPMEWDSIVKHLEVSPAAYDPSTVPPL